MLGAIVRFIVSAIVLMVVGMFVPGFRVTGFVGALVAAAVIAILGYIVEAVLGNKISPRNRGWVGFITAAVVIYLSQFLIPSMISVTVIGALLSAFIIGLVDAFVPTFIR
ncbi:MAG TPA: phage holin family protein [Bacillota bacterium]|nr:phage holin family protein [Bacillota bacterium]